MEAQHGATGKTHLYRHFDMEGRLLYVGISISAMKRLGQHKVHSHWFQQIASMTIESFDTRAAAIDAETRAIMTEKPLHNIKHAKGEEPVHRDTYRLERAVLYRPLYTLTEARKSLGMTGPKLKQLIAEKRLGYVDVGTPEKPVIRITGWQMIDFLESLDSKPLFNE